MYCKFCAFYRTEKDADHYVLSHEQIDRKLDELTAIGGIQILMQGGHHPKLGIDWYLDLLNHIREKYPHINIHAFSPPEFNHFAEVFKMPMREVIAKFKEAGLGSIPGGGGEILVDRVRNRIAPLKCNSDRWLEAMAIAHELGLKSSATMMFGHVETRRGPHRALAAPARPAGRHGRVHGVHLLDVPARAHQAQGHAGRHGGVPADAGAEPDVPG